MVNAVSSANAAVAAGDVGKGHSNGRSGFGPHFVERQGALS